MKFYRDEQIETIAEQRLVSLEKCLGTQLSLPIPIDLVGEKILGLSFLWEEIDELPGETVLGAILPAERLVLLNERRRPLFQEKPGLERSTKGHEMGHWDLFVDESVLDTPSLFEKAGDPAIALRSSPRGSVVVLSGLLAFPEGQEALRRIRSRADEPQEARAVNRYAAALSMPKRMIVDAAQRVDRTKWPNLYRLSETFEVTISALVVRLQQLNMLYIAPDRTLYPSAEEAHGQRSLGF